MGDELVAWALDRFGGCGLKEENLAITLLPFAARLTPACAGQNVQGYGHNGGRSFYPCSVVKLFYLAAAEARLEEGTVQMHGELERAMRDMILWSSNTGTNYIVDLVTGTTGDTLLDDAEMRDWIDKRLWVNRYFRSLGWAEFENLNVCQKLMDDQRYGRESIFVQWGGNNHNRLTTDATTRLLYAILTGSIVTPTRSRHMRDLLERPTDPAFACHPQAQIEGYLGAGLPDGARLWSKCGRTLWTGDENASYRRHDAAYVELPSGKSFILAVFTEGKEVSENAEILPAIAEKVCSLTQQFRAAQPAADMQI